MSERESAGRDRATEVRDLIDDMQLDYGMSEGSFAALGMLITDASLAADEPALRAAHDGLRRLYGQLVPDRDNPKVAEQRGRLLGQIDITFWALRRLPSGLQLNLDPHGHAARFLTEIAREPGLSNEQLADRLKVDITEVSRVGRKLTSAGVAMKSRQWRHNAWTITPRGVTCLEQAGLAEAQVSGTD
ncbi:hypothetical protein [Streptomyces cylindrosporus]|uniref:MarR family transcriptional regulator n=1 Tax=Streptomyces cylindrosporus TaxID=2927583 RepID=A0ABS9YJ30_9ACTN|nr:hypothetical protein [Streptomyces cylindrosporus]MCI3277219.1 hypothetical protein [Streptomyces cylindrosporus]